MRRLLLLLSALLTVSAGSGAQATGTAVTPKPRGAGMEVRQYTLQVLNSSEAVSLLAPFVPFGDGGGVYRASPTVISVIGTRRTLAVADSVLRSYDHAPATLVLRFMLIAATDSAVLDPLIGEVDVELRRLLKFNGYRRLAEATSVVAETERFTSTMSAADRTEFTVDGSVKNVRDGRVGIAISLRSGTKGMMMGVPTSPDTRQLLSTSLTVPLGQTVVLGTAAGENGVAALILTVRPELAQATARQEPEPVARLARSTLSATTVNNSPSDSTLTYKFKVIHQGTPLFSGILHVRGDSMTVESRDGTCRTDQLNPKWIVSTFHCVGMAGVETLALSFDVHNLRNQSKWGGIVTATKTVGRECVSYSTDPKIRGEPFAANRCVVWQPVIKDVKTGVGGKIFLDSVPR